MMEGIRVADLRAGVVGLGGFFKGVHLPCMRRIDGLRIVAACDLDPARRDEAAQLLGNGVAIHADLRDMLSAGGLDALYVITRPGAMAAVVAEAAAARLPVFCEKPPGRTSADTRRMADACARAGVINQVAFNRRFGPLSEKLNEWLAGACPPTRIEVSFRRVYSPSPTEVTGSGIHAIDKLLSLMGPVRRVMGARSSPRPAADGATGWGQFHAAFQFVSGASGSFQLDNREPVPLEQYRLSCVSADTMRADQFVLEFPPPNSQRQSSSVSRRRLEYRDWNPRTGTELDVSEDRFALPEMGPPDDLLVGGGYLAEHQAFAAALRTGQPARPTFADTIHSMEVAEVIQAAGYREFAV